MALTSTLGGGAGKRHACAPAKGHTHLLLAEGMETGEGGQLAKILDNISMTTCLSAKAVFTLL